MNRNCLENRKKNEEELYKETVLESGPRMIYFIITNRCNLKCIMCARSRDGDWTLPFEAVKKIRPLLPVLEIVDWQGGEVFLVDYFRKLFLEVAEYPGILQRITTNGLLIDSRWAGIFASSKCNIQYSIDAVTEKTYESIRKGGRFGELLRSIDTLKNAYARKGREPSLYMTSVVMKRNIGELHLLPAFCREHGFRDICLDFLRPELGYEEDIFFRKDAGAMEHLRKILPEMKEECEKSGIGFDYTFSSFLGGDDSRKPRGGSGGLKCNLPWQRLFVDYRGRVKPDCLCSHFAGNLLEESLGEIWNGGTMKEYRRRLMQGNYENWCSQTCIRNAVREYQFTGRIDARAERP
ncbi:MAG: radical SAM protein [Elusimicrobia bacterium]|nr:radical SAM protein [Elusimicrobiota bacterium]